MKGIEWYIKENLSPKLIKRAQKIVDNEDTFANPRINTNEDKTKPGWINTYYIDKNGDVYIVYYFVDVDQETTDLINDVIANEDLEDDVQEFMDYQIASYLGEN